MSMDYVYYYKSVLGGITISSNGSEITGLWFDGQKYYPENLIKNYNYSELYVFKQTVKWLDIYFSGKCPNFTPPLNIKGSAFRELVWNILLTIPYGKTMTYKEIAKIVEEKTGCIKMSAQAVGGAVGHNPISIIIPCHRVIGSNGSVKGYAGGIDKKIKLLENESVDVNNLFVSNI